MLTEDVFTHAKALANSIEQASSHRAGVCIEAEHRACIEPQHPSQHRAFSIEHRGRGSGMWSTQRTP